MERGLLHKISALSNLLKHATLSFMGFFCKAGHFLSIPGLLLKFYRLLLEGEVLYGVWTLKTFR